MFDIGFTEIAIILVVALVVIGPERLPTVARTLGALLGRLNRYVSEVKADVEREMRLEDLKKLQTEIEQQATSLERSVVQEMEAAQSALKAPVESVQASVAEAVQETGAALQALESTARADLADASAAPAALPAVPPDVAGDAGPPRETPRPPEDKAAA